MTPELGEDLTNCTGMRLFAGLTEGVVLAGPAVWG